MDQFCTSACYTNIFGRPNRRNGPHEKMLLDTMFDRIWTGARWTKVRIRTNGKKICQVGRIPETSRAESPLDRRRLKSFEHKRPQKSVSICPKRH